MPAKKAPAKKAPAKKAPAKKAPAKKAPAKKAPAKKARPHRDLNTVRPGGFVSGEDRAFWDERCRGAAAGSGVPVSVFFGDLGGAVVDFIESAESVVGCVAWLTSKPVLAALASRPGGVSLCVQKETNLRPSSGKWPAELHRRYRELPAGPLRSSMPYPLCALAGPPRIGSVRCVGFANSGASQNAPRMHHKFIVAGGMVDGRWVAQKVWTGSFNFSANAGDSAENAVVVDDAEVAGLFLAEFARMSALSEPLEWRSRVSSPEHKKAR